MNNQRFIDLSRALTGATDLDAQTAAHYEYRLREYFGNDLDQLLAEFAGKQAAGADPEEAVRQALGDVTVFHRIAREIIRAWYIGQFQSPFEDFEPVADVAHYENGLLWRVIQAHAPGFTNAGYGAWAKAPA